ncbi:MAG: EamA family transporter [Casimicrobiaceae bacterium]
MTSAAKAKPAANSSGDVAQHGIPASSLVQIAILTLVWGCNWPVLKLGVTDLAPLTFRSTTLVFAAIGLLIVAKFSGHSLRIPREHWGKVAVLAVCNISAWNGLILFGVQQMAAGRSAIIAYTMPMWAVLISFWLLHEPLSRRKIVGLGLGMCGMLVLLGDDVRSLQSAPMGALLILGAALSWAFGTVLLRRWKLPIPQDTLTGWMMIIGWIPLIICAPLFDPHMLESLAHMPGTAWFAVLYNIFLAGTLAHWAWFKMARTLPVAVSGLASLPVPVVGVLAGMLFLGERPGAGEFIALGLVLASLAAVLFAPGPKATATPASPK